MIDINSLSLEEKILQTKVAQMKKAIKSQNRSARHSFSVRLSPRRRRAVSRNSAVM